MSPSLRRIRWRLIWSSLFALVVSLGSFYLNHWAYSYSDDQCTWAVEPYKILENGRQVTKRRVVIREILPGGVAEEAGLLEGDELLMIRGQRVTADRLNDAQRLINSQPARRVLVYLVRRYDPEKKEYQTLPLPVEMVKPFYPTQLIVLATGLLAWALGLLVVISSPQRKITRHFYYLGVMALLTPLVANPFQGNVPLFFAVPLAVVSQLMLALTPPLWLHFFLRFPYPFPLRTNRRFLVALYGGFLLPGALFSLLQLAVPILGQDLLNEVIRKTGIGLLGFVYALAVGAAFVSGLVMFWVGAFKLGDRRKKALLVALIFCTAILLDFLAYLLFSLRAGPSLVFRRESWIFFAPLPLLPIAFAFAVLRHGLFDVQRALLRWITYFIVLGLTLAAYLGGLAWVFSFGLDAVPPAWVGVLVGVSALPIGWLLRWLLLALRRLFRRDLTQAREMLMGSLRETRRGLSEHGILEGLEGSLREAFRPQVLLVLPVEGRFVNLPKVAEAGEESDVEAQPARKLILGAEVIRHARENQELVLGMGGDEADWIREQGQELRGHMDALEAQVMVLVMANQQPHTVILLGGKYAELNYGREDRELLREVAITAGTLVEASLLHRRLLDQGRIEQELQTARKIQEGLITFEAPCIPGFQMALRLEPALETGGDLLWVKRRSQGKWLAAVGDVSGKGLAAALYMSQATALLKFAAQDENLDFERILPALDQTMRNLMGARDFLTLILLEWDATGEFRLARAGHPPALLISGTRREDICSLVASGRGLGLRPASEGGWQIHEGTLQPGQWIVMYSDGLTEAMNQKGDLYGLPRMEEQLLRMRATGSVRAACEAIYRDVAGFECQNRDDRTLFILGRDA